jgi:hypothetical protein
MRAGKRVNMSKKLRNGDTSLSGLTNIMLDPAKNSSFGEDNSNMNNFSHSYSTSIIDPLKHDAHFASMNRGYQSYQDIKKGRGVENLSFQEWTEKYHQ